MQSSFLELVGPEKYEKARKVWRVTEALFFSLVMYACGGMTGYWLRDNAAKTEIISLKSDHQRDTKRLVDNYTSMLDYLTGRVAQNAASVASAASTSEEAANTALKAANKADAAASKADTAAKASATAVTRAERVPEPTREQINRAVDRANRSVGK